MGDTLDYLNFCEQMGEFDGEFFTHADGDELAYDMTNYHADRIRAIMRLRNPKWCWPRGLRKVFIQVMQPVLNDLPE